MTNYRHWICPISMLTYPYVNPYEEKSIESFETLEVCWSVIEWLKVLKIDIHRSSSVFFSSHDTWHRSWSDHRVTLLLSIDFSHEKKKSEGSVSFKKHTSQYWLSLDHVFLLSFNIIAGEPTEIRRNSGNPYFSCCKNGKYIDNVIPPVLLNRSNE